MDDCDYVELVVFDIHSIPRGCLIAKRRIKEALKTGVGLYSGVCFMGIRGETTLQPYFAIDRDYGSVHLIPIESTCVNQLRSSRGDRKICQVLCDVYRIDGTLEPTTPRFVAQRQVEKLKEDGFTVKSSYELEFTIVDESGKPWGHDEMWVNMNVHGKTQEIFLKMFDEMSEIGMSPDKLCPEGGLGMYEVTLDIAEGIKAADMSSRFKSMSRIFLEKHRLSVSFMTTPYLEVDKVGLHFNLSLWKDGKNTFLDESQPNQMSVVARRWLAGLIKHTPAMTALVCPTVNCYRRLYGDFGPHKSDWKVNGRVTSYRVVSLKGNVYIECRLPSAAASPYIVMAAILAAGRDGIRRNLSLEDADTEAALPKDLESALTLLEKDTYLVETLGKEFVEAFSFSKRNYEIKDLKENDFESDSDLHKAEKKMYFDV